MCTFPVVTSHPQKFVPTMNLKYFVVARFIQNGMLLAFLFLVFCWWPSYFLVNNSVISYENCFSQDHDPAIFFMVLNSALQLLHKVNCNDIAAYSANDTIALVNTATWLSHDIYFLAPLTDIKNLFLTMSIIFCLSVIFII